MGKQRNETESYNRNIGFSYRADFSGGTRVIYEGWAYPGSAEGDAVWQIVKHTYNASSRLTASNWAKFTNNSNVQKSTDDFVFAWTGHDTLLSF